MQKIYKYPLEIVGKQLLIMPFRSVILSASVEVVGEEERIVLYAMVLPESERTETRIIEIFGTGFEMSFSARTFIGTVRTHQSALVWHVFAANTF